jgi:hypothetical protein
LSSPIPSSALPHTPTPNRKTAIQQLDTLVQQTPSPRLRSLTPVHLCLWVDARVRVGVQVSAVIYNMFRTCAAGDFSLVQSTLARQDQVCGSV